MKKKWIKKKYQKFKIFLKIREKVRNISKYSHEKFSLRHYDQIGGNVFCKDVADDRST